MTTTNHIIILLLIGCFCSCHSVSQPVKKSFPIVCLENYLGNDTYAIAVEVKPYSKVTATEYFYKAVQGIVKKKGYARCDVLEIGAYDKKSLMDFGDNHEVKDKIYGKIKCYKD